MNNCCERRKDLFCTVPTGYIERKEEEEEEEEE